MGEMGGVEVFEGGEMSLGVGLFAKRLLNSLIGFGLIGSGVLLR